MNRIRKGFTLAELLIVVAIIAVLVAIVIPIFTSQLEKSREAADLANVRSAYAEVMTAGMTEDGTVTYNGTTIKTGDKYQAIITPLKQAQDDWQTSTDGLEVGEVSYSDNTHWKGIPKANGRCTVTYDPADGSVTIDWGGLDLSTAEGRRQADIDNMHSVANALQKAIEDKSLKMTKNYVQVAVFKDGTMAYFQDGKGGSEADTKIIRDALEKAGLKTDKMDLYSSDANWKNGYVVHVEKDGSVKYKAISEAENENKQIVWNWWNKKDMTDSDL